VGVAIWRAQSVSKCQMAGKTCRPASRSYKLHTRKDGIQYYKVFNILWKNLKNCVFLWSWALQLDSNCLLRTFLVSYINSGRRFRIPLWFSPCSRLVCNSSIGLIDSFIMFPSYLEECRKIGHYCVMGANMTVVNVINDEERK